MANNVYIWDSLSLVAGAIIVYCVAKKGRRSITPLRLFYLCVGCFMVILAVIAMLVGKYDNICASSFLHIVTRTSLPLVLLLIIHGILVAMKLVLVQLFTDCSDLLSELIFHSGVGKSLQKWC